MSERAKLLLKMARQRNIPNNPVSVSNKMWTMVEPNVVSGEAGSSLKLTEHQKENTLANLPNQKNLQQENEPTIVMESSEMEYEASNYFSSDDSVKDPLYTSSADTSSTKTESADNESSTKSEKNESSSKKIGKKRIADPTKWKKNITKHLRNTGAAYISSSNSKKVCKPKEIGPPCKDNCVLKCSSKINEESRKKIFSDYWALGDLQRQREFLSRSMNPIVPKYRYTRDGSNRKNNNAFYFTIQNNKIRVCKTFLKSTLAISDRPIRTVQNKATLFTGGIIESDLRGRHGNHNRVDEEIKISVRQHIDTIPRIESHYCRQDSSGEYIDGAKTVAQLHRDYVADREKDELPYANYLMYHTIFNTEFNISFFRPKKDQCEDCISFENSNENEKAIQKEKYDKHIIEKDLSRKEKENDKNNSDENVVVAVYDLQAVLQCPRGEASGFYYTSKLSVYNFTISTLKPCNDVSCYVWYEGEGLRGVNEIGTCVLKYLQELNSNALNKYLNVIFYSDNCCGQQKNQFMIAMYRYVLSQCQLINSITHKFLIKGHTQNEGDSAHSVIERHISRSLKGGPIYTPEQYFSLIRTAKKKGRPYKLKK